MNSTRRTYLLLDDEGEEQLASIHDLLRGAGQEIDYKLDRPRPFGEEAAAVVASGADGLLIDHNLQAVAADDGTRVEYRARSLAVELRERMAAGELPSIPIVLWSVNGELEKSFAREPSTARPFDWVLRKSVDAEYATYAVEVLMALVSGYKALATREVLHLLRAPDSVVAGLDPRLDAFLRCLDDAPVSEAAQALLHGVVAPSGPLVPDVVLAVRLGIDIKASIGWSALLHSLENAQYGGPFSEGFRRWWWSEVLSFWSTISETPLRSLSAESRVSLLKQAGFADLVPLVPAGEPGVWHVSRVSGLALPASQAVQVLPEPPFPWLDRGYVSEVEVIERLAFRDGWRIHPLERTRISRLTHAD
jgi:hypothetical protein